MNTECKQNLCQKNTPLEINPLDIWEGDLFNREKTAQDFSNIIKSISEPFVISIDAPYGSGKSFFLKRWSENLSKEETVVFFNAWDCDFINEPLTPFLYEFLNQLKEKNLVKSEQSKELINAISLVFNNAIKKGTCDIIDIEKMNENQGSDNFYLKDSSLSKYKDLKENIIKFKDALKKIIQDDKKIYVFIDELERCRPTFAVELLESIKHLFNIPGLVFILGIDRSQLKSTISTIYGQEMDGEGYLRRFIDLELALPEPDKKQFIEMLNKKFDIKIKKSVLGSMDEDIGIFKENLNLYSKAYNLSLRDLEHIYTEFNLINKLDCLNVNLYPLLAFLLVLKYKDKKLYEELDEGRENADWIIERFKKDIEPKLKKDFQKYHQYGKSLIKILVACYEPGNARLEELKRKIQIQSLQRETLEEKRDLLQDGLSFQSNINMNSGINFNEIIKTIKSKLVYSKVNN